jgi:octaprenyl-diphosphate synthase
VLKARKSSGAGPTLEAVAALMGNDLRIVNDIIHKRMQSEVGLIPTLAGHLINSGGKRLRPMLTLACARLVGYDGTLHHSLAAAIEFLHSATLLHDDVVDGSSLRRGRKTANLVWGNRATIFVGDFLLSQSFELMIETKSSRAIELLSRATTKMVRGEIDQLGAARRLESTEADYYGVINAKTADLFAVACRMAAVIAEENDHREKALDSYGRNIGIAFQLVDDAIDYTSNDTAMGKAAGDDFREGKVTLPVILSYRNGDPNVRRFWHDVISGRTSADETALRHALYLMESRGAITETLSRAKDHAEAAKNALQCFPDSDLKRALMEAADFSVSRTS